MTQNTSQPVSPRERTASRIAGRAMARRMVTLRYIRAYIVEHVNAPSVREIRDALDYSSSSMVMVDVKWLIDSGYLVRTGPPGHAKAFTTPQALEAVKASASD